MGDEDISRPLKILVSGDVEGKLNDLYGKVKTIQSKAGKFDILFCIGEFYAESPEDNIQIEENIANPSTIPILTYILGTNKKSRTHYYRDQSGCELSPDKIVFLGSKGLFTTRHGLNIVYLSGFEEKSESKNNEEFVVFNSKDVETLEANLEKRITGDDCVDILLTNQWPKYVEKQSNQLLDNGLNSETFGSELISQFAAKIKPRYHFSATKDVFFERIPYRNHQVLAEKQVHLTRFLALAKANKQNKPKFLYAFNLLPAKKMSNKELAQQTATIASNCPYTNNIETKTGALKRKNSNDDEENSAQYFYDADHIKKMNDLNEKALNEKKKRLEASQNKEKEPCWFCLGGSKVERHYIVSVSDKCYLAYAKGAINKDHLLIIPIDHVQSSIQSDHDLLEDINKFKTALVKYFKTKNKCVLFYERNFRSKHMQIQVFAIKADKSYLIKDVFMSYAKDQDVRLNEIPKFTDLKQVMRPNQSFFYLELLSEEENNEENKFVFDRYLSEIRSQNFPMNFGRDVVASELLLNMPDRVDWKECVKSQEEEKQMSIDFRNDFKKFDPSL